jgi:SpoU rRNA methylase family enzyme
MFSKLAMDVGIIGLAVTAGYGAAAQSDTALPSAEQQVLANGTGPGNVGS